MKLAAAVLIACAAVIASPASAGIPLSKAVKACKAELAKLTPPLKAYYSDDDNTRLNETYMWVAFKVRSAEDRMEKMVCKIDNDGKVVELKTR